MKLPSKSLILILALLLPPLGVLAQASFDLRNYYPPLVNAPVFDALGIPLAGSGYLAELWGAPTPEGLAPLIDLDHGGSRLITPFIEQGYFISTVTASLVVPTVPPSDFAWLQVRAWDASLGATYEEASAQGMGGYGESPVFYAQGADPNREPPEPAAPLIGLESFSLRPVPEPSTLLLLGCGGLVAWCLARRRVKDSFNRRSL